MDSISQQELENFKQQRWFALHHYDNCSICGKEFTSHEDSYIGHLKDGSYAHSCKKCCELMKWFMFYTNRHKLAYRIPPPDTKLWRYMSLTKFLSLLEYRSLFFTRLDHFHDSFEGALGAQKNQASWAEKQEAWRRKWIESKSKFNNTCLSENELQSLAELEFKKFRKNIKEWRTKNYISCWHQSDYESEAMWQLYTKDCTQGIAIQTTFERLYQALPSTEQPDFGMVNYINFNLYNNGKSDMNFHPFEAPWYKREAFSHEKEFRIIIEDIIKNSFRDWDKKIKVDLNMLVENIYISPYAEKWFSALVKDIIKNRYGLRLNVIHSELSEQPFF